MKCQLVSDDDDDGVYMKKMMEVVYVDAIDGFDDGVRGENILKQTGNGLQPIHY